MSDRPEQFLDYARTTPTRPATEAGCSTRFVACWVVGHAWLLVALALYVSMRRFVVGPGAPPLYVLFDNGPYLSATEYWAVQSIALLLGVACIALAFRERAGRVSQPEPRGGDEGASGPR